MKWLTDYITEYGIDGYRVDTVKHVEENVWQEFKKECDFAFTEFKKNNADKVLDNNDFYLVGEVYNYAISNGKEFNFGDKQESFANNSLNLTPGVFLSYFPTYKFTVLGLAQFSQRIDLGNNFSQNYHSLNLKLIRQ